MNAFSLDWKELGFVFACPPPGLAGPAIKQFVKQRARGVLVVPNWPSARFFPLLSKDGTSGRRFVLRLKRWRPFLYKGEDVKSDMFAGRPAFDFLALMIDGGVERPWEENERIFFV